MRICVFGDSVTFASYMKESWANQLRWYLEENSTEDIEFFNLGINGNTSEEILARFDVEAQSREPDKIIFAFGINDSCYIFDTKKPLVEEEVFKNNLVKLIQKAKKHTNDITFVGLTLGDESLLKPFPESSKGKSYSHERARKYDSIIKETAKTNGCNYIDVYDQLNAEDFIDGLHPNEVGHRKMFEVIRKHL